MEAKQALVLTAEKRSIIGKQSKHLRNEGLLPAIVYGRAFEALPLVIDGKEFRQVYATAGGSQLIDLKIKGIKQSEKALVREVQRDPVSRSILHVDLYRVSMTERITTEVSLTLVGESRAAAASDAMIFHGVTSLEIECLPGDLPESIEVDLSKLEEIDQAIFVRDLEVGEGIEVLTDPDEMVVRVSTVRMELPEEEEEEEVEGMADYGEEEAAEESAEEPVE